MGSRVPIVGTSIPCAPHVPDGLGGNTSSHARTRDSISSGERHRDPRGEAVTRCRQLAFPVQFRQNTASARSTGSSYACSPSPALRDVTSRRFTGRGRNARGARSARIGRDGDRVGECRGRGRAQARGGHRRGRPGGVHGRRRGTVRTPVSTLLLLAVREGLLFRRGVQVRARAGRVLLAVSGVGEDVAVWDVSGARDRVVRG